MSLPRSIRSIGIGISVLWLTVLLNAAFAYAAQDAGGGASLAGTWKMESETPNGDPIPWTLTMSQKEGKWQALVSGTPDAKPTEATDLRVSGNKVHFRTLYEGDPYNVDLTLESGSLTGTWSGDNGSGKTTGRRVATP